MATMKAVRMHAYGEAEVLVYEDAPVPEPAAGEVRVRVRAAGVNPFDWKVRLGWFKDGMPLPFPIILGGDFAGVVDALGPGVTTFSPGDEVYGAANFGPSGAYAAFAITGADKIASKPKTLDFNAAASVPTVAITAWQALFDVGGLSAGQTALIHGLGGGVGRFALQLAKQAGARVVGTASASVRDELLRLGADEVIDYKTGRFEEVVRGVDVVLDGVGGETQVRSWGVLKPGGILIAISQPPSEEAAKQHGVRATMLFAQPKGATYAEIGARIDAGKLTLPRIEVMPLAEAARAHTLIQTGKAQKVVLSVDDG